MRRVRSSPPPGGRGLAPALCRALEAVDCTAAAIVGAPVAALREGAQEPRPGAAASTALRGVVCVDVTAWVLCCRGRGRGRFRPRVAGDVLKKDRAALVACALGEKNEALVAKCERRAPSSSGRSPRLARRRRAPASGAGRSDSRRSGAQGGRVPGQEERRRRRGGSVMRSSAPPSCRVGARAAAGADPQKAFCMQYWYCAFS